MKFFTLKLRSYPVGVWIALAALILIFLAWMMQAYSILNWEGAVQLGLQNESFTGIQSEAAIADVERGIAIADLIWALPLTLFAFIGLLKNSFSGFIAAHMVFAICVYFPLFYAFRTSSGNNIIFTALFLWALPSLLAIIGLWLNRGTYLNKRI